MREALVALLFFIDDNEDGSTPASLHKAHHAQQGPREQLSLTRALAFISNYPVIISSQEQ